MAPNVDARSKTNGLKRLLLVVTFLIVGSLVVGILKRPSPLQSQATTSREAGFGVEQRPGPTDDPTAPAGSFEETTRPQSLCQDMPVLPGIEDFEASSCSVGELSEILANEDRDADWATDMEARIRKAIQADAELRFSRVEVVCRMSACGILLILAEDLRGQFVPEQLARIMIEQMTSSLGFQESRGLGWITDDDTQFRLALLERAEGREGFWPAPVEPERVQALPGISGYEVVARNVIPGQSFPTAAELLAVEALDSEWARMMEGRIYSEIATIGIPLTQLHVVCRSTRCGVVLDYLDGTSQRERQAAISDFVTRVKNSLGLNSCPNNVLPLSMTYTALYFEERSDSGCSLDFRERSAP